jgi:septal ring factor EnvC (AmiA/AmiB activator)
MLQLQTRFLCSLLCCILLAACHNDQRERQLAQREQAIIKKESDFALKEADYKSLLKMRDSLRTKKDTVVIQSWPETIAGVWNSKAVCRESNCSEYVIGDQRANFWEFISDSTGLFTRVLDANNKLVRVYTAQLDSSGIKLHFLSDSSAARKLDIHFDLSQINQELLKGTQAINIDQACNAKFSVELTRATAR